MEQNSSYSPALWGTILIPIISGTEIFIVPPGKENVGFFVLGFFYLVSIRYSLAVALGVFSHETALKRFNISKIGAILWFSYLIILVLCSLLVPGATIFGLLATVLITMLILIFSIVQGYLSLNQKEHNLEGVENEKIDLKEIKWRLLLDVLLLLFLVYEYFISANFSFQSTFFAIIFILISDFFINDFASKTIKEMYISLKIYLDSSWNNNAT